MAAQAVDSRGSLRRVAAGNDMRRRAAAADGSSLQQKRGGAMAAVSADSAYRHIIRENILVVLDKRVNVR